MTLIKKYLLALLLLTMPATSIHAAMLNVFHDNPEAKISIDGRLYITNSVQTDVTPGDHYIKVLIDDVPVYAEIITVEEGKKSTIINTSPPLIQATNSNIPDAGPQSEELKRLKKLKGSFGVGLHVGSVSGLSLKKFFGSNGFQVHGWGQDDANRSYFQYNVRYLRTLASKLVSTRDWPVSLYAGIGYGNKNVDLKTTDYFNLYGKSFEVYEAILGIEMPSILGRYNIDFGFSTIELLYRDIQSDDADTNKSGLIINLGHHIYF